MRQYHNLRTGRIYNMMHDALFCEEPDIFI